jgi:hypothetical protein
VKPLGPLFPALSAPTLCASKPPPPATPHQTPSLVPPRLLGAILAALRARYGIAPGAEVTIEADPGTFDAGLLREYRDLGFTRLSVGVQSFQEVRRAGAAVWVEGGARQERGPAAAGGARDTRAPHPAAATEATAARGSAPCLPTHHQDLLRACGRAHDLADVRAALSAVASSGFPTWSLDLMSGLPGLTRAGWAATLAEALAAAPPHVSVYDLQVSPGGIPAE